MRTANRAPIHTVQPRQLIRSQPSSPEQHPALEIRRPGPSADGRFGIETQTGGVEWPDLDRGGVEGFGEGGVGGGGGEVCAAG